MNILKRKPKGFVRFEESESADHLLDLSGFLKRYDIECIVYRGKGWCSYLAAPTEQTELAKELLGSKEYIQFDLDKGRRDGFDVRSLDECIAFQRNITGTYTGEAADILKRHGVIQ